MKEWKIVRKLADAASEPEKGHVDRERVGDTKPVNKRHAKAFWLAVLLVAVLVLPLVSLGLKLWFNQPQMNVQIDGNNNDGPITLAGRDHIEVESETEAKTKQLNERRERLNSEVGKLGPQGAKTDLLNRFETIGNPSGRSLEEFILQLDLIEAKLAYLNENYERAIESVGDQQGDFADRIRHDCWTQLHEFSQAENELSKSSISTRANQKSQLRLDTISIVNKIIHDNHGVTLDDIAGLIKKVDSCHQSHKQVTGSEYDKIDLVQLKIVLLGSWFKLAPQYSDQAGEEINAYSDTLLEAFEALNEYREKLIAFGCPFPDRIRTTHLSNIANGSQDVFFVCQHLLANDCDFVEGWRKRAANADLELTEAINNATKGEEVNAKAEWVFPIFQIAARAFEREEHEKVLEPLERSLAWIKNPKIAELVPESQLQTIKNGAKEIRAKLPEELNRKSVLAQ